MGVTTVKEGQDRTPCVFPPPAPQLLFLSAPKDSTTTMEPTRTTVHPGPAGKASSRPTVSLCGESKDSLS